MVKLPTIVSAASDKVYNYSNGGLEKFVKDNANEEGRFKQIDASMLQKLVKLAATLDQRGLYKEASVIDKILQNLIKGE